MAASENRRPRKWFFMTVAFVTGLVIGWLNPAEWLYWTIAEKMLPQIKQASLSKESPFESIVKEQWIAESENAFAVHDIEPQAPIHFLVIPKERITSLLETSPELMAEMMLLATETAAKQGIAEDGFRIVINTNPRGAQTVYHLHIHVIGGRQMRWPPG